MNFLERLCGKGTELRHLRRELAAVEMDLATSRDDIDRIAPGDIAKADTQPIISESGEVLPPQAASVAEATRLWTLRIQEPSRDGQVANDAGLIDAFITHGPGGWEWLATYVKNGQKGHSWCGHFVGSVMVAVGLNPQLRRQVLPSTYRLWKYWGGTDRAIRLEAIQPGDIVVVGPEGSKRGKHIALCSAAPTEKGVPTIEGNAKGKGPDGKTYEGVVRQFRPWKPKKEKTYRPLLAYRPLPGDWT
jgi:hypothetical protein